MIRDKFEPVNLTSSTLEILIEQYLSQMKSYSTSTRRTHTKTLSEFFSYFENSNTFLFMPIDIEKYVDFLKEKGLSDNSVKTYISSLRKFCEFLTDGFILEKNPVKRVKIRNVKSEIEHAILTDEEVQILLWTMSAGDEVSIRDRLIVSLILYCGFTLDELSNIKLSQIEKKRKYWYIETEIPFNHELNNNAVPTQMTKSLEDHLEQMESRKSEFLFVSYSNKSLNKQLTVRGLTIILKDRLMKAGFDGKRFKYVTPSDLRKTSISIAIKNGARAKYLMNKYNIKHQATLEKYR